MSELNPSFPLRTPNTCPIKKNKKLRKMNVPLVHTHTHLGHSTLRTLHRVRCDSDNSRKKKKGEKGRGEGCAGISISSFFCFVLFFCFFLLSCFCVLLFVVAPP